LSKKLVKDTEFDENSRNFEDWDFYFRVCEKALSMGYPIEIVNVIGVNYSDDDQNSLSRSKKVSASLLFPPNLVLNRCLPEKIRQFTFGIWLIHISQRLGFTKAISIIYKTWKNDFNIKTSYKYLFSAIVASLLGVRGWDFLSKIRKYFRYD
jgi:hypothetical protein